MLARFYVTQPVSHPYLIHSEDEELPVVKRRVFQHEHQVEPLHLTDLYPIAFRNVIKKIIPSILGVFLIGIILFLLHFDIGFGLPSEQIQKPLEMALLALGLGLLLFSGVKFIYESLYRYTYAYGVHDGHFYVSKGVMLKRRGSFPLARITDVYVDRSFIDLIFGLYNLHISTPTTTSGQFARIEGLAKSTAQQMQVHLRKLIEHFQGSRGELDNLRVAELNRGQLRYLVNGN